MALDVDSIFGALLFLSVPINFTCLVCQAYLEDGDMTGWAWLVTLTSLLVALGTVLVIFRHDRRKKDQRQALDTLAGSLVGSVGYSKKLQIAFNVFDHYGEGTSNARRALEPTGRRQRVTTRGRKLRVCVRVCERATVRGSHPCHRHGCTSLLLTR